MIAHFFDIDSLIRVESAVWIVSKLKPTVPLIKLTPSEFNLIKKGIYKKYNSQLSVGGKSYWIPQNLMDQIKIKCKVHNCNITDISFSMQEFMNPELISTLNHEILIDNIQHLKNSSDDIYIICSKNTKSNYESIIDKVEQSLSEIGLKIKNFYFISETFYNRDSDIISHKKVRLLIQHLVGLRTDEDRFTDEQITKYETIYYYDDEIRAIELAKDVNTVLNFIINNSSDDIRKRVKEELRENKTSLVVNQATHNKIQPFLTTNVKLSFHNLIKNFESFKFKF